MHFTKKNSSERRGEILYLVISFSIHLSRLMKRIQQLPSHVANLVRAGGNLYSFLLGIEELLLNSVDAGATQVALSVSCRNLSFSVCE